MTAQLDLRELAVDRPKTQSASPGKQRNWLTRYGIPAAILLGFASLLAWAVRDHFLPKKPVTVVPVVMKRAEVRQEGTPLFQAAGWIEPRPTAINVAALTQGVVEELLVVEGQQVEANEPVARLVQIDAELARREARAALELRAAELESIQAEQKAAKTRLENPVHLEAALAEAESQLAKTETQLAKVPFLIQSAKARVDFARKNLAGKRRAGSAIPQRTIQQVESELAEAQANWQELKQRKPRLEKEAEALRRKVASLKTERDLLIDETRAVEDAQARLRAAKARHDQAKLAVDKAELDLERTVIRSPSAGRVMKLVAFPGTRVMGMNHSSRQSSSTVVTLYDPKRLQVRADVRLEDVPLVQPGQPVTIETASSDEPLRGRVLLPTSSANIQKNTLEVKVAIEDPPKAVTPEMLVTATFLAPPQPKSDEDESEDSERLLIPRDLVDDASGSPAVWIADASGLARKRSVELGKAGTEELVEVTRGLTPTDKLISGGREALSDGDRITITGEDDDLGVENSRS